MALTKIEASNIAAGAVASSGFNSVQVFTASDTWARPTDITKVIVEVQGGGAGVRERLQIKALVELEVQQLVVTLMYPALMAPHKMGLGHNPQVPF